MIYQHSQEISQERQAAVRHKDEVVLKFVELGWDAILKHDSARSMDACRVLSLFDQHMGQELQRIAMGDTLTPTSLHRDTTRARYEPIAIAGLLTASVRIQGYKDDGTNLTRAVSRYAAKLRGEKELPIEWKVRDADSGFRSSMMWYSRKNKEVAELLRDRLESRFDAQLVFVMNEVEDGKEDIILLVVP